jgi:hypothetical protein
MAARVLGCFWAVALFLWATVAGAELRVSADGKSFTEGGAPFFWMGSTQWAIFRSYSIADANTIVDSMKPHGFSLMATMLVGGTDATIANIENEKAWLNNDPSTPNEAYFTRVDQIVKHANDQGLLVRIGMLHNSQLQYMSSGRGRAYAKWVATRYKDLPNIVWSLHGNVDDAALVAMVREMAAGIQEGDGGSHLISQKPDPSPKSSGQIQSEPWLSFTESQTWNRIDLIYSMVTTDYARTPPKPTVMDEGAYEAGPEYGFPITPILVRRQAYYSYLAGGSHTYGHTDTLNANPTWKASLDAPGALALGFMKKAFLSLPEWWLLTPDQSVLTMGAGTTGDVLYLGARHKTGKWAVVYAAAQRMLTVDMSKLSAGPVHAQWMDPRSGTRMALGDLPNTGTHAFGMPGGWEDALLILTTEVGAGAAPQDASSDGTAVSNDASMSGAGGNGGMVSTDGAATSPPADAAISTHPGDAMGPAPPGVSGEQGGCGCAVPGRSRSGGAYAGATLVLLARVRRRRREPTTARPRKSHQPS